MDTKLTLRLDDRVIKKAKKFARRNHVSLSSLVETYFKSLIDENDKAKYKATPTVRKLIGTLKVSDNLTPEEVRDDFLLEKYLNE